MDGNEGESGFGISAGTNPALHSDPGSRGNFTAESFFNTDR